SEVMSDTAMSARGMAMKKKIQFVTQPPENDFVILGDYELIRKLLMLILDNAVKYTESGKSIYYYQTDRGEIVIQDEGIGMDQEAVSHIFKRFYRQGKGIERGSSGMGLAIAKEIAVRHQIEIQVESTVGTGTTFTLVFPVDKISVEN
ncbi:sensor histidine kinase, partial [Holdemania filiformis]